MANIQLTQELVKELFEYRDGFLYWKVSRTVRIKVGDLAGSVSPTHSGPRRMIRIGSSGCYYASRLIFLYHKGYLPKMVDHRDRDCTNDKIENLRDADKHQNAWNVSKQANKTSKYIGVSLRIHKKTKLVKSTGLMKTYISFAWLAQLTVKGKKIFIGYFKTEKEAAIAYNESAKIHHGEFAHLNIIK